MQQSKVINTIKLYPLTPNAYKSNQFLIITTSVIMIGVTDNDLKASLSELRKATYLKCVVYMECKVWYFLSYYMQLVLMYILISDFLND